MRTARLVGPTADGTSMVLVTEDGEELTVALDPDDPVLPPALRQAPGGPGGPGGTPPPAAAAPAAPSRRPPRRRETPPMHTSLSPRDIQARIRSGESLEDVVADSGMDPDRVERFAAPVLAEREHVALTALGSSVRRRGESSGHRPLRAVVAERLLGQGVDADEVAWDAWKREDGHWQVSGDYELRGEARHAEFHYDPQGRFSVAEDDDARWLAGERPSPVAAVVDRDDELALVRATREPSDGAPAKPGEAVADDGAPEEPSGSEDVQAAALEVAEELTAVLQVVPPAELSEEELAALAADDPGTDDPEREAAGDAPQDAAAPYPGAASPEAGRREGDEDVRGSAGRTPRDEAAEPTVAVVRHLTRVTVAAEVTQGEDAGQSGGLEEARSALDTLYDMLGGDGYAEESTRVYAGLSDAAAVPVVDEHEFEPPAAVHVPADPGPETREPETGPPPAEAAPHTTGGGVGTASADDTSGTKAHEQAADKADEQAHEADRTRAAEPAAGEVRHAAAEAPPVADVPEPLIPSPGAPRTPGRRKRASVPSWDEIMFGGPKPG